MVYTQREGREQGRESSFDKTGNNKSWFDTTPIPSKENRVRSESESGYGPGRVVMTGWISTVVMRWKIDINPPSKGREGIFIV